VKKFCTRIERDLECCIEKNSARILFFDLHIQWTNTRERARNPYFIAIIFTRAMFVDLSNTLAVNNVHDASAFACDV
jgi:hypothetical protein